MVLHHISQLAHLVVIRPATLDAYERLFLDAINGDQSLFVGREEIEESWRWIDQLISACQQRKVDAKPYHAGSWGPAKAEVLIEKDFRSWHV